MKTTNDFKIGMRVKQYDNEDGCNVYGHVTEIRDKSIVVRWNDLMEPCEHFEDEFPSIKHGIPSAE